jgi:hypothetical protein
MFNIETSATIRSITVSAKTIDGVTTRRCRIKLDREFDDAIAACIGPEAKRALDGVKSGAIERLTFPIDAVLAKLDLVAQDGGETVAIERVVGVRAVAKSARQNDVSPSVRLEFEFPFFRSAWIFMGENVGAVANIEVKPAAQGTLKFEPRVVG